MTRAQILRSLLWAAPGDVMAIPDADFVRNYKLIGKIVHRLWSPGGFRTRFRIKLDHPAMNVKFTNVE